jgi:hypothetical protein
MEMNFRAFDLVLRHDEIPQYINAHTYQRREDQRNQNERDCQGYRRYKSRWHFISASVRHNSTISTL